MKPDRERLGQYIRGAREMKEEYGRRTEDGLDVQAPFGWRVRANGRSVIFVVVVGLLGAGFGYMLYQHDERSKEQTAAIVQSIQEMAFVLTLTEAEKKALQLTMPAAMRERLLKQQRELRGTEYRRYDQ